MSQQRYYSSSRGQSKDSGYDSAARYYESRSRGHAPPSRHPPDYISQPAYSTSDHISRSAQPSYSEHDTRGTLKPKHRSRSDYIGRPAESRGDYITPHVDNNDPYSFSQPLYDSRDAQYNSRDHSPVRYSTSRNADDRRSTSSIPPYKEKSDYRIVKDGWGSRHNFMRSHGLTPGEPEDYEEATKLIARYREIDAQQAFEARSSNQESSKSGYNRARRSNRASRSTEHGSTRRSGGSTYPGQQQFRHTETYDDNSDIASYQDGVFSDPDSSGSCTAQSDFSSIPSERRDGGSSVSRKPSGLPAALQGFSSAVPTHRDRDRDAYPSRGTHNPPRTPRGFSSIPDSHQDPGNRPSRQSQPAYGHQGGFSSVPPTDRDRAPYPARSPRGPPTTHRGFAPMPPVLHDSDFEEDGYASSDMTSDNILYCSDFEDGIHSGSDSFFDKGFVGSNAVSGFRGNDEDAVGRYCSDDGWGSDNVHGDGRYFDDDYYDD